METSTSPAALIGRQPDIRREIDLAICGESETAGATRAALAALKPDVLICDIDLRQFDGIELIRYVRAHYPLLPVLVLSTQDEALYAERLLSIGATGYIMKQATPDQFLVSLRRVLDGQTYVSEAGSLCMIQKYAAGGTYLSGDPIELLSNRELQVLFMIGKGMSTRETADSLHLSMQTVESHRQRIKQKLNLSSGTQLVRYAVERFSRISVG